MAIKTKYEYDENGNRFKKIFPRNHIEYYNYDIEGRLAQITQVGGNIETFVYVGDGNRIYRSIELGDIFQEASETEEEIVVTDEGKYNYP